MSTQINKLSKRVASTQAAVDQAVDAGASKTVLERDLRNSRRALQLARDVLSDAGTLRKLIDQSGYSIGVRAAIIVGAVNAELRAQGKQIEDIKTTLDNAKSISDAFKDLAEKSTTEETDGDDASAATGTSTSSGAAVQKQPQLAGSVSSPMVFAGSAMWVSAAAAVAASGAASAAPRRPVLVVINKVPVTQIKAEIAQLKDFIVDKEAQKKHLEAMQRNAAHDKTVAELKTKLEAGEKKLAELQKKLDGAIWAQNLVGGWPMAEARRQLAIETETLFAARRPVLQALINFRAQTLAVRSATQCNSNAAGLRIFPAENRRVRAGDKLEFVASETGGAAPALLLQGNAGSSPKGSFVVVTTGTITRATLTIGCDAPSGPLLLVATDSKVRHTETIRLTVQAAGDKNKTCAAPKTEAPAKE